MPSPNSDKTTDRKRKACDEPDSDPGEQKRAREHTPTTPTPVDVPCEGVPYAKETFEYLKEREVTTAVQPDYLARQSKNGITARHREMIVNWMAKTAQDLNILDEGLVTAVGIMDRYCCKSDVTPDDYHLVSAASLLLGSSLIAQDHPTPEAFVGRMRLWDEEAIVRKQLVQKNWEIFFSIMDQSSFPTPLTFAHRFLQIVGYDSDPELKAYCQFVCEASLYMAEMAYVRPSLLACAAVVAVRRQLEESVVYPDQLWAHSGYKWEEVLPVLESLETMIEQWPKRQKRENGSLGCPATFSKFRKVARGLKRRCEVEAISVSVAVVDEVAAVDIRVSRKRKTYTKEDFKKSEEEEENASKKQRIGKK